MSEKTAPTPWYWGEPTGRETRAVVVAALYVSLIGVLDAFYNGRISLIGFLAIGPFIAAAFARPLLTLMIGLYAAVLAGSLSSALHEFATVNHLLRVGTVLLATGVAVFVSSWRIHVEAAIEKARTAEAEERRRRVAAETAEHLQSLAGALNTASAPEQVAEAIFEALRREIEANAALFCTISDGANLRTHRTFGFGAHVSQLHSFDLAPDHPLINRDDLAARRIRQFARGFGGQVAHFGLRVGRPRRSVRGRRATHRLRPIGWGPGCRMAPTPHIRCQRCLLPDHAGWHSSAIGRASSTDHYRA